MKKVLPIILLILLVSSLLVFRLWSSTSQMVNAEENTNLDILDDVPDDIDENFTPVGKSKVWEKLLDIDFEDTPMGLIPYFLPHHEDLDGKILTVDGYMYPLEEGKGKQTYFMLSYYPISMCFFCGGAGPQSIIEVYSEKGIQLSQKRIKLKGKLYLNKTDTKHLFYLLKNAKLN